MPRTAAAPPSPTFPAGPEEPLPRWRDRSVLALLALALALQLHTIGIVEGYALADEVEYLDRAQLVLEGEAPLPPSMRSFAFSALLLPFFWAARALELESYAPVVGWVRAAQMVVALACIVLTVRLGARIGGRRVGIAAGYALAINPIFLQYGVSPLSGMAATLCVAAALTRLLEPGGFRSGLAAGGWIGGAVLMAFKTIPIVGAFLIAAWLRDRFRRPRFHLGIVVAVAALLLAQLGLDRAVYGPRASTLGGYVTANFVGAIASTVYELGLEGLAIDIYDTLNVEEALSAASQEERLDQGIRSATSRGWYLRKLPGRLLGWGFFGCLVVGALAFLRRPSWPRATILFCLAANVLALSMKGSKSFRLWLPLLPLVAILVGMGWSAILGRGRGALRAMFAIVLLVWGGTAALDILHETNLRPYAGYWHAMEVVDETVEREGPAAMGRARDGTRRRPIVASVYHWAVNYRSSPAVELKKLPHHFDIWPRLEPQQREACVRVLRHADWILGHLQAFRQDSEILRALNADFVVYDLFYDEASYEVLEPIVLFRHDRPGAPQRRLWTRSATDDPAAASARAARPFRVRFGGGDEPAIELLGWRVETEFSGPGAAWLELDWWAPEDVEADLVVAKRVTFPWGGSWQLDSEPAYGAQPCGDWRAGTLVSEGVVVSLPGGVLSLGGPWCRGELVPAELWLGVRAEVPDEADEPALLAADAPPGARASHDGLVSVGRFFVPVPDALRLPDDGRRVPELRGDAP